MSAPIPEDLQELHASTAEWDGSLMVKFAQTHGIELPWQGSPDAAVRRCLIERVALSTAENTYLFQRIAALEAQLSAMTADRDLWQGQHNDDCPNTAKVENLEAQIHTLREALVIARREIESGVREYGALAKMGEYEIALSLQHPNIQTIAAALAAPEKP